MKNENNNTKDNISPLAIFANRLFDVMHYRDISCKELARKIYVAPSTISGYRNGDRNPSVSELVNIADKLNVSLDYLTGRTDQFKDFHEDTEQSGSKDTDSDL